MIDPLIEPDALLKQIGDPDLVVLDASWYLPTQNRDCEAEFQRCRIPSAQFFDIDRISDQETELPHMVPMPAHFSMEVEKLGVSNSSTVVVYDSAGIFSSARAWWLFRAFGHSRVQVLNGGLMQWMKRGFETSASSGDALPGTFVSRFDQSFVAEMKHIRINCEEPSAKVLDARPHARFTGQDPEPRPGLSRGHIPGSASLPCSQLLDDGRMKSTKELIRIFDSHGIEPDTPVITSCGSGVTAAIITLALYRCGLGMQKLYDGSWAEWGSSDNPVETGSPGDVP